MRVCRAIANFPQLVAELEETGFHCACCGVRREAKKTERCGKCRVMRYCGRECQRTHLAVHQPLCTQLALVKYGSDGDRVAVLRDLNLAEFGAVTAPVGYAQARCVRVLVGNIVQEESMWRDMGDFKSAAAARILIVKSYAKIATLQCSIADIPCEHRHGEMRGFEEDRAITIHNEVGDDMKLQFELARVLANKHGPDTLQVELRETEKLVRATLAASKEQLTVARPEQYVEPEANRGRC